MHFVLILVNLFILCFTFFIFAIAIDYIQRERTFVTLSRVKHSILKMKVYWTIVKHKKWHHLLLLPMRIIYELIVEFKNQFCKSFHVQLYDSSNENYVKVGFCNINSVNEKWSCVWLFLKYWFSLLLNINFIQRFMI